MNVEMLPLLVDVTGSAFESLDSSPDSFSFSDPHCERLARVTLKTDLRAQELRLHIVHYRLTNLGSWLDTTQPELTQTTAMSSTIT